MEKQEDGRFYVETSAGTRFHAKVVIIAAGVGSFQARPLKVKGIEKFEGTQLHYSCKDPSLFEGKNVVILGGGDFTLNLGGFMLGGIGTATFGAILLNAIMQFGENRRNH